MSEFIHKIEQALGLAPADIPSPAAPPAPPAPIAPAAPPAPLSPAAAPASVILNAPGNNFPRCLAFVLREEGGFVDNPADPGGPTNMGITQATLEKYLGRPVTVDYMRDLTPDIAQEIYLANYWNVVRAGEMPHGVDLVVFDPGVMSGPSRGVKFLQAAINITLPQGVAIKVDGEIGQITVNALAAVIDIPALINLIAKERTDFYQELVETVPTDAEFIAGWQGRASRCSSLALTMVVAA